MKTRVVAVVGHVDHGKTSLVKALTGVDTDSLKEEKRRGLTISLGFAYRNTPSGVVNLIDAPGHSDFIRTTVSGLSGADAILLVVSAVDGIQAQTREHVEVARLLGIQHAIVAITKTDLCEAKECSKLIEDVAFLLRGKGFLDSPIILCSLQSNEGIQAIELELIQLFVQPVARAAKLGFFLPIDRVFSKDGAGTVVTGTLLGGPIGIDDEGVITPANTLVSIRNLHVNGEPVRSANSGARIAVALRGGAATSVSKGDVLCATEIYEPSNVFDVALKLADIENLKLKHMEHVTVLHGTGYATARLRLFEPTQQQSGVVIYAQLKFTDRQVAFAGQRFILRRPASGITIAGGTVLDPTPCERQRKKTLHLKVLKQVKNGVLSDITMALAERDGGSISIAETARLSRLPNARVAQKISRDFDIDRQGFAIQKNKLSDVKAAYIKELKRKHEAQPCRPFISIDLIRNVFRTVHNSALLRVEEGLIRSRVICVKNRNVALCEHDPFAVMSPDQMLAFDLFDSDLKQMGLSPVHNTGMKEKDEDFAELLVWCGRAVRLYNHALRQYVLLHAEIMKNAHSALISAYPSPTTFTTSEARLLLGTSRKIIVPVLEYFDEQDVTLRQGNERSILKETFTIVSPKDQV
jgi:selenocysteine-specific elongation factor